MVGVVANDVEVKQLEVKETKGDKTTKLTVPLGRMKFLSCFKRADAADGDRRYGRLGIDDEAGASSERSPLAQTSGVRVEGCVFCGVSKEKGFDVVHEDDELVVFRDRWPRAKEHLLIIPRNHIISTVHDLNSSHIPLIRRMQALSLTLFPDLTPSISTSSTSSVSVKTGFHIPPFSSVHHLHMHVLVPPYTGMGRVQYPVSNGREGRGKGWGWFVTPSQAVEVLEDGGRIGIAASSSTKARVG